MKTERLVLLVTPDVKARIAANAARLGVSASEFVRQAIEMFDAEDMVAMEELAALVPELNAMADRIEARIVESRASTTAHEAQLAYQRSPEYREKVRQEVAADDSIDWDAVRTLFGFASPEGRAA